MKKNDKVGTEIVKIAEIRGARPGHHGAKGAQSSTLSQRSVVCVGDSIAAAATETRPCR